jgi:hypothetical protein
MRRACSELRASCVGRKIMGGERDFGLTTSCRLSPNSHLPWIPAKACNMPLTPFQCVHLIVEAQVSTLDCRIREILRY